MPENVMDNFNFYAYTTSSTAQADSSYIPGRVYKCLNSADEYEFYLSGAPKEVLFTITKDFGFKISEKFDKKSREEIKKLLEPLCKDLQDGFAENIAGKLKRSMSPETEDPNISYAQYREHPYGGRIYRDYNEPAEPLDANF